jgi:hypothetical protein
VRKHPGADRRPLKTRETIDYDCGIQNHGRVAVFITNSLVYSAFGLGD